MKDLIRTKQGGEENDTVKITIVDDNSFSSIPDNCKDDIGNRSTRGLCYRNSSRNMNCSDTVRYDHGYLRVDRVGDHEGSRDESNRIMLDGFRRRQRFLRETLSPKRTVPRSSTESPLRSSPSPIITQRTPTGMENPILEEDAQQRRRDSQRSRMNRLRTNLREQQNSSPPLL